MRLAQITFEEDAKGRILRAAVRHFGAHGFLGSSLRNILSDAGANIAAANYHFGSKEGLYLAVIDAYLARTRDVRRDGLVEAEARLPPGGDRLRALVRAYAAPHIELVVGGGEHDYGRLIARLAQEPEHIIRRVLETEINPIRIEFRDALRRCCPWVDDARLSQGIGMVAAVMLAAPFDRSYGALNARSPLDEPAARVVALATDFAWGGLTSLFGGEG